MQLTRGAAISAAKVTHPTLWQGHLARTGKSIPEWVKTQEEALGWRRAPGVEAARSWVKRKGKGGRPIPAIWAERLAAEFQDPELLRPESWPSGIRGDGAKYSPRPGYVRSGTPEYRAWWNMIDRCANPKSKTWVYYGARGISVCLEWRTSFERFCADMGARPSSRHSIDRIDNDGNYEPTNCRWATAVEQRANQRRPSTYRKKQ